MNEINYPITGTCQCGAVHYELSKPPITTVVCHCIDCQKLSTGGSAMTMFIQADSFNLIRGALKSWTRDAASGAKAVCYFCPECGNRIYHVNPAKPEVLRLKPGALNDTRIIKPQSHAWVSRKQNWVEIPEGMPTHETQPEDLSDLIPSSNKQLAAD